MKNTTYILLLCLSFSLFTIPCQAQDYLTDLRHYNITDGLSHGQVLDIHKDKSGMMWVLAKDKINRFDGLRFSPIDHQRPFYYYARIIGEDGTGDLWIHSAYEKGDMIFFNTRTQEIKTFAEKFEGTVLVDHLSAEGNNVAMEFYHTSFSGDYFFGTKEGSLIRFDPKEKTVVTTSFDKGNRVLPFFETSDGLIWVNVIRKKVNYRGNSDVIALDKKRQVIHKIELDDIAINLNAIGEKEFSFSTFTDFYTVDKFGKATKYPLSDFSRRPDPNSNSVRFHHIRYDSKSEQYWMFNEFQEVLVFHPEKGLLENISNQNRKFRPNSFNNLFLDENGVAWMGTIDGLYKMSCRPNKFQQYFSINGNDKKKDIVSCRGITSNSEGTVFVNAKDAIFKLESKTTANSFLNSTSHSSAVDGVDHFWVTDSGSLVELKGKKVIQSWKLDAGIIWTIDKGENRIWIAGEGKEPTLHYLDLTTRKLLVFEQYNGFDELRNSIIYSIHKMEDGKLWLISTKGIFILDENLGIQARYWSGGEGEFNIPVDDLRHLYQDKEGIIWLATSQGLVKWDKQNKRSQRLTTEDGLPHNNIYAVYEDDFGFLWFSTDNGIGQFQKNSGRIKTYLPSDGISHHEFNRISHHQVCKSNDPKQNGMIYFGGLNGLTAFHPKDFVADFDRQPDIPLSLLSSSIFSNKTGKEENISDELIKNKKIIVNPGDQSLNIEFALLEYDNPQLVQYEYQIEGFNNNWIPLKNNSLLLNGLPYGEFEVTIRAKTGNGVYSLQQLEIPIEVLRPFYLQWWFALLVIGALSTLLFLIYKWRTNELINQKLNLEKEVNERTKTMAEQAKELKNLDEVKSRFFANISHELRTPLTLILGPLNTVLQKNKIDKDDSQLLSTAHQNAQNLLRLTNEILDLTKLEALKMELKESPVILLTETRRIFSFFETQAYQQGIDFQFLNDINPNLQVQLDKDKFEKILTNLLSNALKFTPKGGAIKLKLENGGADIKVKITDTGKGISATDLPLIFERYYQSKEKNAPTEGGTGIGLALCKEFSKLFDGEILVESELGKGSTFIFKFPKKEIPLEIAPAILPKASNDNNAIPGLLEEFNVSALQKETEGIKRPTVLVVEDNADLRAFLKLILQKQYNILTAENGKEGWEILQKNNTLTKVQPIDMILSDVMMPVMDGFQFLEKIKSDPEFAAIPVVMLTARVELQDRLKALRIGVDDYILKPFEEEELLIRIQNLLKNAVSRKVYKKEAVVEVVETGLVVAEIPELNEVDQNWLSNIEEKVIQNISNFDFNAEVLAQNIFISRRQLDRRLKVMTGLTTGEYIREAKLQEARRLIESRKFKTIKEISFKVGIKSVAYFSKKYKERFGRGPGRG